MKRFAFGVLLVLSASADAQHSVTTRETARNSFTATLLTREELSIADAQGRLKSAAADACKGLVPAFGKYTFRSSKAISAPSSAVDGFEFSQNFTCVSSVPEAADGARLTVMSDADKAQLVELVTNETGRLIGSADKSVFRDFHSRFSPSLADMLPFAEWMDQQTQIHEGAGAIQGAPLLKVTTYIDPPNSPGPGTYVAVDFQASYDSAPFRCGYVMWLLDQQSKLSVLRVENGIVYSKDAASMSAEAIETTKRQFRCFTP